jgi:hypothetical protein
MCSFGVLFAFRRLKDSLKLVRTKPRVKAIPYAQIPAQLVRWIYHSTLYHMICGGSHFDDDVGESPPDDQNRS